MSLPRLTLLVLLGFASPLAGQQNLIVNGDFDQDLAHWQVMASPAPEWQAEDALGAPDSGSVLTYRDADIGGGVQLTLGQCVNFEPGLRYYFGALARKPPGQSIGITGRIMVQIYGGPDCTLGNPVTHSGSQANSPDWTLTSVFHPVAIPGQHASAWVSLGIASITSDPLRTFEFDAVFAHSDRIHRGNFEAVEL